MVMNKTIRIEVTWTSLRTHAHCLASLSLLMRVPPQAPCIINTFSARLPIELRDDGGLLEPLSHPEIFAYCNEEDNIVFCI